ncbi:MAG: hypothetical protein ACI3ZP_00405 [Candidatus Cryptobacteroides sp.]
MEGQLDAPSTLWASFVEGAAFIVAPSTLREIFVEGSMTQRGTIHAGGQKQGRFWALLRLLRSRAQQPAGKRAFPGARRSPVEL